MEVQDLVTHRFKDGEIEFQIANFPGEEVINYALSHDHNWEPWQLNLMRRVIRPDFTCVDVGANIGVNALFMSRLCPRGRVYAFEPFDDTFACFRHNVELNHIENIIALNKGASSENRSLKMVMEGKNVGGAHVGDHEVREGATVRGPFEFVRLDEELDRQRVKRIDFIKIDVEGFEPHVLAGAGELLDNRDLQMVVEFNPTMLRSAGSTGGATGPFMDRRLFEKLRSLFRHIFYMNRDQSLFELDDYHSLRQCLLGGYFLDDLYCTNDIPEAVRPLIIGRAKIPYQVPITHDSWHAFGVSYCNRMGDNWVCADSVSPATASVVVSGGEDRMLRLRFDAIHRKHLHDPNIPSWPVHVIIGDLSLTLDLMDTPREIDFSYSRSAPPRITIESSHWTPATAYLGNDKDPRRVGFRFEVVDAEPDLP